MLGSRVFRRVLPFGVPLRRTAFETERGRFIEIFTASTGAGWEHYYNIAMSLTMGSEQRPVFIDHRIKSLTAKGFPSAAGAGSHGALAPAIPISITWSSSSRSTVRMT